MNGQFADDELDAALDLSFRRYEKYQSLPLCAGGLSIVLVGNRRGPSLSKPEVG